MQWPASPSAFQLDGGGRGVSGRGKEGGGAAVRAEFACGEARGRFPGGSGEREFGETGSGERGNRTAGRVGKRVWELESHKNLAQMRRISDERYCTRKAGYTVLSAFWTGPYEIRKPETFGHLVFRWARSGGAAPQYEWRTMSPRSMTCLPVPSGIFTCCCRARKWSGDLRVNSPGGTCSRTNPPCSSVRPLTLHPAS